MLFLVACVLWLTLVFSTAKFVASLEGAPRVGRTIVALGFVALAPLPIADELLSGSSVEALCKENASIVLDVANPRGRTVWLNAEEPTYTHARFLPVAIIPFTYVDAASAENIFHYKRVEVGGGVVWRTLTGSGVPLTFDAVCQPGGTDGFARSHGIIQIERPKIQ